MSIFNHFTFTLKMSTNAFWVAVLIMGVVLTPLGLISVSVLGISKDLTAKKVNIPQLIFNDAIVMSKE